MTQTSHDAALAVVRSHWGTLRVTGPERRSWLNGLVTCDVVNLEPGRAAWGLALTRTGKITSEVRVMDAQDVLWIATSNEVADALAERLDRMLIMEDAELEDRSAEFAWISVHGSDAVDSARRASASKSLPSAAIDWTGLGDALILVPRHELDGVVQELERLGARLAGDDEWLRLRLEYGVPEYGSDFTESHNPHEASLDRRAVSWSKGCYLGQEVVCMQDMRGKVRRRLKCLTIDTSSPPASGSAVDSAESDSGDAGQPVGHVTSAAYSAALGRVVALALVKNDVVPGVALRVAQAEARVVEPAPLAAALDAGDGSTGFPSKPLSDEGAGTAS